MDLQIRGRKAIVCASSRGLGRGCAEALAAEGVDVVLNGKDEAVLERTAAEIRKKADVEVSAVCADVTSPEGQRKLLESCPEPDILINNAGGPPPGDFREWDRADWTKACEANMFTPIELIRATVDGMIARRFGRIINISSTEGKVGKAVFTAYTAAKHAVNGLTKSLAQEVGAAGITVNAICPGLVITDIVKDNGPATAQAMGMTFDEMVDMFAQEAAIKRPNTVEEVAAMAVLLASEAGAGITGATLSVDGGTAPY